MTATLTAPAAWAGVTALTGLGYGWVYAMDVPGKIVTIAPFSLLTLDDAREYQETHPEVASALGNVGEIHEARGDLKEALSFFSQAAAISVVDLIGPSIAGSGAPGRR